MNPIRSKLPRETAETKVDRTSNVMNRASFTSYTIGFGVSLALTLTSFYLVSNHVFRGWNMIYTIMALAAAQLIVQLVFFLHLGREGRPRWNQGVFLFMLTVLLILVVGSLWIMKNLNYHMMTPIETNKYIQDEEQIYR